MDTRLAIDGWQSAYTDEEGNVRGVDFRMESDEEGRTFKGYAAVFDSESEDLGGFRETIAPGAFAKTLRERKDDHKAFVNHDWGRLLGSRKAGTLRLKEDDYGLHAEIDLPDTQEGRDIGTLGRRGDIHAMSFGFRPVRTESLEGGRLQRLHEVKLYEVSPVTSWPAYRATTASVRHLADLIDAPEDEVAAAIRALTSEGDLTDEHHDLLSRALAARAPQPIATPLLDAARQRLAAYTA